MQIIHRIEICCNEKLLASAEAIGHDGSMLLEQFSEIVKERDSFTIKEYISNGERRILESTPYGMKVLSKEILFTPKS